MYQKTVFTIENWQTQKIRVEQVPEAIYQITLGEILSDHWGNCTRTLNFNELFFYLVFRLQGWTVYTLPLNKKDPVIKYVIIILSETFNLVPEAITEKGCPDFLLVNENKKSYRFKFVEIKAAERCLNKNQMSWADTYKYDVFIVRPHAKNEQNTYKDIIEENKMLRHCGMRACRC